MAFHKILPSHLIVSEASWFSQMSAEAKKMHINKVLCCKPVSTSTPNGTNQASLSVSIEDNGITSVSKATLENVWKKAGELMKSGDSILSVPWSSDKKCRLVKSYSSGQPHMVTVNSRNRNKYSKLCDEKCPMFKGYAICAHSIEAAEDNGDLKSFLNCITCKPNLTAFASTGMPSGSGRKGGKAKRKRSRSIIPIETRSTRPCLLQSSCRSTQMLSPLAESTPGTSQPTTTSSATPGPILSAFLPFKG